MRTMSFIVLVLADLVLQERSARANLMVCTWVCNHYGHSVNSESIGKVRPVRVNVESRIISVAQQDTNKVTATKVLRKKN